ncbi:MAG: family 10 glycosylhydrolase [Cyclonatronaceae bacterium]
MKTITAFIFSAVLFAGCSRADDRPADAAAVGEIRGVWITNVDSDVLFSKQAIAKAMDYLAAHGFNTVFPVVWNKGLTLYPSDVMADYFGEEFRIDTVFTDGRDPLQELIVEARRVGMEVMPWFEFGFSSSYQDSGGYILQQYPHWAARDVNGDLLAKNGFEWMNALHPEVQDFMLALVHEVITNYDIDGIQGDDRLPAMPAEGGYSEYTRALYERETGRQVPDDPREPRFLQWKADKLTSFGGRLYTMVKNQDPDIMVSLSPSIYPWSLNEYLQDWPVWIRREQVDLLHPQNYRYEIERYISTADTMAWYAGLTTDESGNRFIPEHSVVIAPGILIKAGPRYNGPDYVMEAVAHNRLLGLNGEVFFFYEGLGASNEHLADTLYKYYYSEPASQPHRHGRERVIPAEIATAGAGAFEPAGGWTETVSDDAYGGSYYISLTDSAWVTFNLTAERGGRYDLYVHYPYGTVIETTPGIRVNRSEGVLSFRPEFTDGITGGWIPVSSLDISDSGDVTVTISGNANLIADAVMLLQNHKVIK